MCAFFREEVNWISNRFPCGKTFKLQMNLICIQLQVTSGSTVLYPPGRQGRCEPVRPSLHSSGQRPVLSSSLLPSWRSSAGTESSAAHEPWPSTLTCRRNKQRQQINHLRNFYGPNRRLQLLLAHTMRYKKVISKCMVKNQQQQVRLGSWFDLT